MELHNQTAAVGHSVAVIVAAVLIVFPGTGIQNNFADKARKLGINAYDFRKRGGA
ncbi:hypothetical protein MesoLjLc_17620 [Mesorhizobium sp. L-8-10]|nr:hypothetical protein MesoLjLc_17620 [Mesorhizobium sp. L-8-10]